MCGNGEVIGATGSLRWCASCFVFCCALVCHDCFHPEFIAILWGVWGSWFVHAGSDAYPAVSVFLI